MSDKMREALEQIVGVPVGMVDTSYRMRLIAKIALAEQPAQPAPGKPERSNRQFLTPDWIAAEDAAGGVTAAGALATSEQPAQGETSPENEAERFIQAAIDRAPKPLRRLGAYLARVLDADHWPTAEGLLLAIATAPPAPAVPDGWKLAMRQLVYYARTSGGTAGPDPTLMEACEACEKLLAAAPEMKS